VASTSASRPNRAASVATKIGPAFATKAGSSKTRTSAAMVGHMGSTDLNVSPFHRTNLNTGTSTMAGLTLECHIQARDQLRGGLTPAGDHCGNWVSMVCYFRSVFNGL